MAGIWANGARGYGPVPRGHRHAVEEIPITESILAQARAYAQDTATALARTPASGVTPAASELLLARLAVDVGSRLLGSAARQRGVDIGIRIDDAGWPPLIILSDADQGEPAYICPVPGESSLEPRPVWPVLVREQLVGAVLYHAYLNVWVPAHEKLAVAAQDRSAAGAGRVAGWLDGAAARQLKRTTVAPHIGNEIGGEFRAGKVAGLRDVDELLALAAGRQLALRG